MNFKEFWQKNKFRLVAVLFSAIGIWLRFKCMLGRGVWIDEIVQMKLAEGPLKPFWQRVSFGSELTCFPGEYLLTWPFAKVFGMSRWAFEIPHALAMLVSFCFLYLVCKRYLRTLTGWLVTYSLFVFNSQLIFHALEIRAYAILIALSLAVFYLTDILIREPGRFSIGQKLGAGIFLVLVIAAHAYGILLVFFCGVFFLLWQYRQESFRKGLPGFLAFWTPVAVVGGGVFLWYVTGQGAIEGSSLDNPFSDTFLYIPNPVVNPVGFLKAIFGNLIGFKMLYPLLLGMAVPLFLSTKDRWPQLGMFLLLVALPIGIIMMADVMSGYWFLQRQFIWITPLFAVLLGWCWDSLAVFLVSRKSGFIRRKTKE